jgi:uncharacterized protein (TIGR00730 family)
MAAVAVFCASSRRLAPGWLDLAREFGRALAARGHTLVSGGGRVGMMGAVAEGARAAGGHTLGVIPQALMDQEVADADADELVVTADMASRKTLMMDRADAFVVLPGGIGTLDELFEVWTTAALGLHDKMLVLVDADGFYTGMTDWLAGLAQKGFLPEHSLRLLRVVRHLDEALDAVESVG